MRHGAHEDELAIAVSLWRLRGLKHITDRGNACGASIAVSLWRLRGLKQHGHGNQHADQYRGLPMETARIETP